MLNNFLSVTSMTNGELLWKLLCKTPPRFCVTAAGRTKQVHFGKPGRFCSQLLQIELIKRQYSCVSGEIEGSFSINTVFFWKLSNGLQQVDGFHDLLAKTFN